jgi:hypothetical protein
VPRTFCWLRVRLGRPHRFEQVSMFVRHGDAHVAQDVQARLVIAVGDEPGDFFEGLFDLLRRRLPHDADLLPGDQVGADPARTVASVSRWSGSGAG